MAYGVPFYDMDFSPEEIDVSPPCFLVDNSQTEESIQIYGSESDAHVTILKQLPIFALSTRSGFPSSSLTNEALEGLYQNTKPVSCPSGSGSANGDNRRGESGDHGGQDRNHGQDRGGGNSSRDGGGRGEDQGPGDGEGGYGGGGGDDGRGGGDDDDNNDNAPGEIEQESPPTDQAPSSSNSDSLPCLVRPESIVSSGQTFLLAELGHGAERIAHSDSSTSGIVFQNVSGGSGHESSGDHNSQASTRIVGRGDDIAADVPSAESLSETSTAPVVSPVETEKKSTSSSSIGKSGGGSTGSTNSYQGDLSSLSSNASVQLSPAIRKHLPLLSILRTQSTSDTSSSSAGSKENKTCGAVAGHAVHEMKEGNESESCSSQKDMFADEEVDKEQVHGPSDLSSDNSDILHVPPQHHSTPTESHISKGVDHLGHKELLHQVVTRQQLSTPSEDGRLLPTPTSQGTPIENVTRFQSLQFSGEPTARETSSSGKELPSPEEQSSGQVLIPSSPTAGQDMSSGREPIREEQSSQNEHAKKREAINADKEPSGISKAATQLSKSFDLSQAEQPTALKQRETPFHVDEVMLPRWQQLHEVIAQDSACSEGNLPVLNSSSSEKTSSDDGFKVDSRVSQMREWQSITSIPETSLSSDSSKTDTAERLLSISDKDQPEKVQLLVDYSLSQCGTPVPLISKVQCPKKTTQDKQSLSPSSLALDPFNTERSSSRGTDEGPSNAPGPTQPEMSEDVFCPTTSQESSQQVQDIPVYQPADQPMGEDNDKNGDDSQEIVFSLHLTQSQVDMNSQMPMDDDIQEVATLGEVSTDATREGPAEITKDDEETASKKRESTCDDKTLETIPSLTKQDSGSQSILAPLVQPLGIQPLQVPSATDLSGALDRGTIQEPSSQKVVNVTEVKADKTGENELGTSENVLITLPEQSSAMKDIASADLSREPPSTSEEGGLRWEPSKSRLATIFSETSSESGQSVGFHFSLPKQPLRPLISTTPPPIQPSHHDTPDSQERGSRRSILPDVVLPVVSETPGMSSQAPHTSLGQLRPPSLTVSMPRHGSPLSDSENTQPLIRFDTTLPPVATLPFASTTEQPYASEPPRSIFSRAREALAKSKKRQADVDIEQDPFAFIVEDEDPEPLGKRRKRGSPRPARESDLRALRADGGNDESRVSSEEDAEGRLSLSEEQSLDRNKEHHASTKPSSKRMRHDESSDSGQNEASPEREAKRARREDNTSKSTEEPGSTSSGPGRFQQITHTRTVTTITTHVRHVFTVSVVEKNSGKVVEVLTYEEDNNPTVESSEKENEEVCELVESSSRVGSRVTPKPTKHKDVLPRQRGSPRIKKPVSSKKQTDSEKNKSGDGLDESVTESGVKENRPLVGDETLEVPTITRQTTQPVAEDEQALQRTSSSEASLTPGSRVLAKWLDGYFYPGTITTKQYKNGRYLVTFDDGDKRRIPRENIIVKDLLPAGQSVMAQGDFEDDFYEEGVIVGHYRDGNERGYEIQTQNGAISRFPRSRVILSEQQGAAIISSESSFNVTSSSSVSIGAHSLRLRKDTSAGSSGTSPRIVKSPVSMGTKDSSFKETSSGSSDDKKGRKKMASSPPHASPKVREAKASESSGETPKSSHKSTIKARAHVRRAGHRIAQSSESGSSDEQSARPAKQRQVRRGLSAAYGTKSPSRLPVQAPSEQSTRRSPRKHMSTNVEDTAQGDLPANRNLFAGLAFLVTGVERDRNEPEESDSESEVIEFSRDSIKRQIEAAGGVVLSSFPQSQLSGAECFLISNRHQRTQKFFQSLASGIPCVSHVWIHDCCFFNKRLDYKKYLLPAGESLDAESIVECQPRRNILGNMRVYLHGSHKFEQTWRSVLLAAGSKMVSKIPNRLEYQCDVVICEDHKVPASLKHAADVFGIPLVSLEWLLQSLINGRQMPFDGHPKYDYRYNKP